MPQTLVLLIHTPVVQYVVQYTLYILGHSPSVSLTIQVCTHSLTGFGQYNKYEYIYYLREKLRCFGMSAYIYTIHYTGYPTIL